MGEKKRKHVFAYFFIFKKLGQKCQIAKDVIFIFSFKAFFLLE